MQTDLFANGECLIDATTFEYFTTCRRSFQYYKIHKREPNTKRPALEAGGIFHTLVEHRRRYDHVQALPELEMEQCHLARLCYQGWETSFEDPHISALLTKKHPDADPSVLRELYPGFTPALDDFRTEANMINTVCAYNREYPQEPFEPLFNAEGEPLVEVSFMLPITAFEVNSKIIKFYWTGKLDLPSKWSDGTLWNIDTKTSQRDAGFDDYLNDQAQIGYLWALWKTTGILPQGFMIDKVIWRAPSKSGKGTTFARHKERIEESRIVEWEHNTIAVLEDLVHEYTRDYWPMHRKWCVGKYGACPYLDVCKLPPNGRQVLLEGNFYKDVTWSPLRGVNPKLIRK